MVETSSQVRGTSGRNEKIEKIADRLRALSPEDRRIAVGFLSGAPRQGRLGVGWSMISSLPESPGRRGDALTLRDVDAALEEIAAMSGSGSTRRRREALTELFERATSDEGAFLRSLLLGDLRQGAARGVMLEAIAAATGAEADEVRAAHTRSGDLVGTLDALERPGSAAAGDASRTVRLFRPLSPMLAGSAETVDEALAKLGEALVEAKADGARVQLHRRDGVVRIFSRTGNDVSASVPEIVAATESFDGDDFVLDGEALVWTDGRPRPFQVTMRRFGAAGADRDTRAALPLRVFVFDCLYANGRETLDLPLSERRSLLEDIVPAELRLPSRRVATDDELASATAFAETVRATGFEGVMVKSLTATYGAGRRGSAWLKVKPVHTLDLVVLAAEWGSGRREGWLSNLHLGARDPEGGFVMLGKTFKGLSDALLEWQTEALQAIEIRRTRRTVWVRPELVIEIAFDAVQESPRYPAGLTLRFARVKGYRPDKPVEEADTIDEVREIFRAAGGLGPGVGGPDRPGTATANPGDQGDLFATDGDGDD
ncbi:MAG: ATP-dependent DNA ligase [Gemmatimonadetes bacterium]|nr:ATP-dependent DNA ligase [Gemmatimonadota bacterium]